jgi:hypothetical protein
VGVVEDARYNDVTAESVSMSYLPVVQSQRYLRSIEVRTSGTPTALAGAVRQALRESEPRLVVGAIEPSTNGPSDPFVSSVSSAGSPLRLARRHSASRASVSTGRSRTRSGVVPPKWAYAWHLAPTEMLCSRSLSVRHCCLSPSAEPQACHSPLSPHAPWPVCCTARLRRIPPRTERRSARSFLFLPLLRICRRGEASRLDPMAALRRE